LSSLIIPSSYTRELFTTSIIIFILNSATYTFSSRVKFSLPLFKRVDTYDKRGTTYGIYDTFET